MPRSGMQRSGNKGLGLVGWAHPIV